MDEPTGEFRPPYLSFTTFWAFLEELTAKPLPPIVDRSIMSTKSGTDQISLTAALRSFELVDTAQNVTGLKALEQSTEDDRIRWLAEQLRLRYAKQIEVSEQNGTEHQLRQSFRDTFGITGADTLRKAVTFFLHAAQKASIPLSPHFPATRSGSGAPGGPKPKKGTGTKRKPTKPTGGGAGGSEAPEAQPQQQGDGLTIELRSGGMVSVSVDVNLFSLSAEDRDFVIELVDKLKGYRQSDAADSDEEG